MGRPTSLNDLVAKRICDAVAMGNARRTAAAAAGVSWTSMSNWMRRGRTGEEPFASFLARLKKADAEAEMAMVRVVVEGAIEKGDTRAALAWLRIRRPRVWSEPEPRGEERRDLSEEPVAALLEAASRDPRIIDLVKAG